MFKKMLIAASLILSSSLAFADDGRFYVGADLGNTKVDKFVDNYGSFGVLGGYQVSPQLAFELGHRRLLSLNLFGVDVDMKQTSFSVLGSLNLAKDFDVYGRLGYNKLTASASYWGSGGSSSDSGVLAGLGVSYNLTSSTSVRLEYQKPASDSRNIGAALLIKF